MRFGSERDYESEDLGKFGLGLKTASLSQCLKFTVATRQNPNRADISAYCWDVDHVSATNRWEILPVKAAEMHDGVRTHLKETTGTVITWERLDRILGYRSPMASRRASTFTPCAGNSKTTWPWSFTVFSLARCAASVWPSTSTRTRWPLGTHSPKRSKHQEARREILPHGGPQRQRRHHRRALRAAPPVAFLFARGLQPRVRPREVEQAAGLLRVPCRPHDSKRRLERFASAR
jgi:hypothetical protein